MKHTSTPWELSVSCDEITDKNGRIIAGIYDLSDDETGEEAMENGKLIHRACNSHDELVEACKGVIEFLKDGAMKNERKCFVAMLVIDFMEYE